MAKKTEVIARPGTFEIRLVREFDAPVSLVFRAHVEPALYSKWYGCRAMTVRLDVFEPRTGGTYRVYEKIGDAPEALYRGVFHEVTPEVRIVQTGQAAAAAGAPPEPVVLETISFVSIGSERTCVSRQLLFPSVRDRDAMVEYGIEHGMSQGFEKLDELLLTPT